MRTYIDHGTAVALDKSRHDRYGLAIDDEGTGMVAADRVEDVDKGDMFLVAMIRKYLELNAESDSFVGLGKVYRRTVWVREAYGRVVVVAAEWIATRHQRT